VFLAASLLKDGGLVSAYTSMAGLYVVPLDLTFLVLISFYGKVYPFEFRRNGPDAYT
jgi:hypothetical protein